MDNGWDASAQAWIRDQGEHGDFGRRFVLDPVMMPLAMRTSTRHVLDVGCGEGRFCRMLAARGVRATGLEPAVSLLEQARRLDPGGVYVKGEAEALPFDAGSFDLVVSYLTLIDIADIGRAIAEMVRVLAPGGRLLVANLSSFNTAGAGNTAGTELGWVRDASGKKLYFAMDHYSEGRAAWISYRDIRILNHHRPLSAYMRLFLEQGLRLTHFDEPLPTPDAPAETADGYRRAPWFCVMEWARTR